MSNTETTLSVRIPAELNARLGKISKRLNLKKIDFIRFVLESSTHIDEEKLKRLIQDLYTESISEGMQAIVSEKR